jgi:hypothetical protein
MGIFSTGTQPIKNTRQAFDENERTVNEPNQNGAQTPANRKLFVEAIVAALVAIKTQRTAQDGEVAILANKKALLALVDKKLASMERRHASDHRQADAANQPAES